MKTLLLITATLSLIGLTNFVNDLTGNERKPNSSLDHQTIELFSNYDKKFGIGDPVSNGNDLRYEVRGIYNRSIKKATLEKAKTLGDIISCYPVNWISSYVSVEISGTNNGNFLIAKGANDILTEEQQKILANADMASDVAIKVNYAYNVPIDNTIENNTMQVLLTVVPETEAEYFGGYQEMMKYFKVNGVGINTKIENMRSVSGRVKFTVNESGDLENVRMSKKTGDSRLDQLLIETVSKMPKWKPAQNSNGLKVKQEFELIVGKGNEGC